MSGHLGEFMVLFQDFGGILEEMILSYVQHDLHLKQQKCLFSQESVEYLAHIIDAAGLHKSPEKVLWLHQHHVRSASYVHF